MELRRIQRGLFSHHGWFAVLRATGRISSQTNKDAKPANRGINSPRILRMKRGVYTAFGMLTFYYKAYRIRDAIVVAYG
jgi:hypothetical protein